MLPLPSREVSSGLRMCAPSGVTRDCRFSTVSRAMMGLSLVVGDGLGKGFEDDEADRLRLDADLQAAIDGRLQVEPCCTRRAHVPASSSSASTGDAWLMAARRASSMHRRSMRSPLPG